MDQIWNRNSKPTRFKPTIFLLLDLKTALNLFKSKNATAVPINPGDSHFLGYNPFYNSVILQIKIHAKASGFYGP
jgi:hypothetical protein